MFGLTKEPTDRSLIFCVWAAVRSFLARICQAQNPTKTMNKSEETRQGLDDVGFIGIENNRSLRTELSENETTLFENLESSRSPRARL